LYRVDDYQFFVLSFVSMGGGGPGVLVFYDYFAHSTIFQVILCICICVYFTKRGCSSTTRA